MRMLRLILISFFLLHCYYSWDDDRCCHDYGMGDVCVRPCNVCDELPDDLVDAKLVQHG